LMTEALTTSSRVLGHNHPNTLRAMSILAESLNRQRRYGEAEGYGREAFDSSLRLWGLHHPITRSAICSLGHALLNQEDKADEAQELVRQYPSLFEVLQETND